MEVASRNGNGRPHVGHTCLLYSSPRDFVAGVGEFVLDGIAGGAAVLVALPTARLGLLHRELDGLAERIDYIDMSTVGRNPGRILPALLTFADRHLRQSVRIVGEPIWAGRSRAEIVEAIRHEALLNLAFAGTAVEVLCPYETHALTADVMSAASRTHPTIMSHGRCTLSPNYADPAEVTATCDLAGLPEPTAARTLLVTSATLPSLRARVAAFATRNGAPPGRAADLATAADDLATAALRRGTPIATVRLWRDHDSLIAEVTDPVALGTPPGARPPAEPPAPGSRRGLSLIHQLCDLVEMRATDDAVIHRLHLHTP